MSEPFPYPQTLGRTRELNTVTPTPNVALPRATQPEATSLFTQFANYVNNYLGNVPAANAIKDTESIDKAAKVSAGSPSAFTSIIDSFTQSATKIKTLADELLVAGGYTVSRVDPAAVPGVTPAPKTTQYQYPNQIDQKVKSVVAAGTDFIDQIKGMFNLAYEKPMEQKAVVASSVGGIGPAGGWTFLILIALILWMG